MPRFQTTATKIAPTVVQNTCMPRPKNNCDVGRCPTSASIGNPKVHLKGRKPASRWAHAGIKASGTRRPENRSSITKYVSYRALTRVVQSVTIPRTQRFIVRIR